jgi:hypothetical protein
MASCKHTTFIYFVQAGQGGPIKIGHATQPRRRLSELQVSSPVLLTLLGKVRGRPAHEKEWHSRFAGYRIRGEWFKPSPALLAAIDGARSERDRRVEPLYPDHLVNFAARRLNMPDLREKPNWLQIIADFEMALDAREAAFDARYLAGNVQTTFRDIAP